jgi:hypothetical protein|tara:strand:- start:1755 stop:3782 length:2028 start_codon:yes stop_codon:yes gene_type:complete
MALVNFTDLDFDQIKTSLKDYLRANSNFTDYDFEGSNLSSIIDVLAYNTYINSYNANMISNEVFIDSATLRENVVALARNIGYTPRSRTSAKAIVSFFVDTSGFTTKPITLTLKKGIVSTSAATFGSESYSFSIPSDITVPVIDGIATFGDVEIYEGSFLTSNFTVTAQNPAPPVRYILDNPHIDTSTLEVAVRDTEASTTSKKFVFSDTLIEVTDTSRVYFIQEVDDQRYELIFGDGVFGEKLESLNYIDVSYITTNGASGNGVSSFSFNGRVVDNNNNLVSTGISVITTVSDSIGGKEIESVDSVKRFAPKIYSTFNRAVTAGDYEALIPKIYPEAESVSVFGGEELSPPQYGKVFVTIKPFYGPFVPDSIKNNLKTQLRKYSVAGIICEIQDLKYLYVETDVNAYYNPNLAPDANAVKTVVTNNITKYSDSSEMNKYGAKFKYSKFQGIVDNSHDAITSNITKVEIRRDMKPALNQSAEYELCFGNQFYIKRMDGYNIKSSGFNVFGSSNTVYLGDLPAANGKTGSLFFFRLQGVNSPVIVSNNVGTIDYERGEILLKAVNITGTSKKVQDIPIIEVSACPQSNDVIGLQDLYLQLDVQKSSVDMVTDTIASGDNTSGNLYTATSSYKSVHIARLTESEIAGSTENTSAVTSDTYTVGSTTSSPSVPSSSSY